MQCNGQCHLAKQLNVDFTGTAKRESGILTISRAFVPLYFQEVLLFNFESLPSDHDCLNFGYQRSLFSFTDEVPNPPPQLLS